MKILKLGLGLATVASLGACGALVNAIAGPQTVNDPINLLSQGASISVAKAGPAAGTSLAPAATLGSATIEGLPFADGEALPLAPGAYRIDVEFGGEATLALPDGPATINLTNASAKVRLEDPTSPAVVFVLGQAPGAATLTRTAAAGGQTTYSFAGTLKVSYTLEGAQLQALTKLLTTGGENKAVVQMSVDADTLAQGQQLTIEVTRSTGTITF